MTKPGDYVIVVDAADAMENGDLIRVREVDGYGRLHLFGFDGPWNPDRFKDAPTYLELAEQRAALLAALQVSMRWMEWWLSHDLCECEGNHVCGKTERQAELDGCRAAIAKALGKETT